MNSLPTLLAGLGLLLTTAAAHAQNAPAADVAPALKPLAASRYPTTTLGLGLGWGAPYGWGVELAYLATTNLDVNAGVGFTITGGKFGIGTRYFFHPERKVSAFVGGNLVYSTGLHDIHITTNTTSSNGGSTYYASGDDAVVNYLPTQLLHLRGGVRWQPIRRFAMLGALGYGVVLGGEPVQYVSGNFNSQSVRNFANLLAPGGVELSFGVAFGLD
ncbi:hypothetical protein MON38_15585 [Hymenobacter sp. DH14]|uniref:Outer membrane protein beta-barrel domain-containing protein n=1 Tax=Hymenobacter cyanobacteriorum TaxID=2926463 RepID=A0A9X2AIN5_9BACT|nr:hypothetical protein [Hymenobacter cyanobacteriorum]MCI1188845.1 hypothetical protein [Hymenobacter cyanobacteriorum]